MKVSLIKTAGILLSFLIVFTWACKTKEAYSSDYLIAKQNFHSMLIKNEKAPQDYQELLSNEDFLKVTYPSYGNELQGLLVRKNIDSSKRKPVLVYLHGGFALGDGDLYDCEVFTEQGYIVFAPTYRGENGNAGNFELFLGEVSDAKEAVKWIAKQPFADSNKIYVFGHSIGGGVSSMLSLEKDVPIAKSGSSGGLYDKEFYGWDDIVPFDKKNSKEAMIPVLIDNLQSMQMNHYAYIGNEDEGFTYNKAYLDEKAKNTKLKIFYTEGDHFTSLEPAMKNFIQLINSSGN